MGTQNLTIGIFIRESADSLCRDSSKKTLVLFYYIMFMWEKIPGSPQWGSLGNRLQFVWRDLNVASFPGLPLLQAIYNVLLIAVWKAWRQGRPWNKTTCRSLQRLEVEEWDYGSLEQLCHACKMRAEFLETSCLQITTAESVWVWPYWLYQLL